MVTNFHMAGNTAAINNDNVIAYNAVVRNMGGCHNQTVFSELSIAECFGTAVDGHRFADGSTVANDYLSIFAIKLKILRNSRNYSSGKNAAVLSNACAIHDGHVGSDPGTFTNFYVTRDCCERFYDHIFLYSCPLIYGC